MKDIFARIGFVATIVIGVGLIVLASSQGFDPLNSLWNGFCGFTGLCDVRNSEDFVEEAVIWTRLQERAVLDAGKFERNGQWRAERTTLAFFTHSMRMRGTVNITLGLNLGAIQEADVQVDNEAEIITIALPPLQSVECFVADVEYYDRVCIDVCDDLERDLQRQAIESSLNSEEYQLFRTASLDRVKTELAKLINIGNLTDIEYSLRFTEQTVNPPPIPGATCPGS